VGGRTRWIRVPERTRLARGTILSQPLCEKVQARLIDWTGRYEDIYFPGNGTGHHLRVSPFSSGERILWLILREPIMLTIETSAFRSCFPAGRMEKQTRCTGPGNNLVMKKMEKGLLGLLGKRLDKKCGFNKIEICDSFSKETWNLKGFIIFWGGLFNIIKLFSFGALARS